jgi:hypothetical protein
MRWQDGACAAPTLAPGARTPRPSARSVASSPHRQGRSLQHIYRSTRPPQALRVASVARAAELPAARRGSRFMSESSVSKARNATARDLRCGRGARGEHAEQRSPSARPPAEGPPTPARSINCALMD